MEVYNLTTGKTLAKNARLAASFFSRLKGLLGTKYLAAGEGLVIRPCNSIHTFGMNYPIDVVFADGEGRVKRMAAYLGPRRVMVCQGSRFVVELPPGTLAQTGTMVGDYLRLA
jgi:uncharacterized membrane protein (UPF0127 family)